MAVGLRKEWIPHYNLRNTTEHSKLFYNGISIVKRFKKTDVEFLKKMWNTMHSLKECKEHYHQDGEC